MALPAYALRATAGPARHSSGVSVRPRPAGTARCCRRTAPRPGRPAAGSSGGVEQARRPPPRRRPARPPAGPGWRASRTAARISSSVTVTMSCDVAPACAPAAARRLLDPQRVGDACAGLLDRPGHPLALVQRVAGVGGELGLHPDDHGVRAQRPDRGGDAGDQAAAADRHEHQVRLRAVGARSPARSCPGRRSPQGRRTAGSACSRARRSAPRWRPAGPAGPARRSRPRPRTPGRRRS